MKFHHQNISTSMDSEAILRAIWPSQAQYRYAGAHLLGAIAQSPEKFIDGTYLNQLCEKKQISRATMQKVFVHLRTLGLVERRQACYHLNAEFATALRRLSESWKKLKSNSKFDFDENRVKINL